MTQLFFLDGQTLDDSAYPTAQAVVAANYPEGYVVGDSNEVRDSEGYSTDDYVHSLELPPLYTLTVEGTVIATSFLPERLIERYKALYSYSKEINVEESPLGLGWGLYGGSFIGFITTVEVL